MRIIDNTLFVEWREAVECGFSENTLKNAKLRNSPSWHFISDPNDKRRVLIGFEKMKDEYKEKIIQRFGNPYDFMARQPIRDLVKYDHQAEQFYLEYKYDGNKKLSTEHIQKYATAASWLNMFKGVIEDKKSLKKLLNLNIEKFWEHSIELIKTEAVDLPVSYRRLLATLKEYETNSYASLIDWRFGNKLAAKVKDELSESTLLEMIAHPNQYDDVFIALQYNKWAKDNNYKIIDVATVGVWRRKKEHLIMMHREGNSELNEKFLPQVKGFRPSAPLYMVESDDNHLDLLFTDPDDSSPSKDYHKYKAIVVIDSFNDYVLGYAYAEKLSIELVKAAYLNAMYHIRSITGAWYLPHETKTDKWAAKTLTPFYKSLGKYIDTPVGSKHRGYIEPFFGSPHWKRCIKIGANNYTGNNMTAKSRGVNQEAVQRNIKNRPLIGNEAFTQIENFFHRLRHMPQTSGSNVSKHDQWLSAFNATADNQKRLISDEQFLLKFGIEHNTRENGIRITNRGIEPQINNVRYSYDLQTPSLLEYVGKAVSVFYDPYDMSRVLVTDHDKIRLMGYDARLNSRAFQDAHLDSLTYLNASLNEKRDDVNYIAEKGERRKQVMESAGIDAETLLQAGVLVKELRQVAEQKFLVPVALSGAESQRNYLDEI
jgi:hypothetical protein